MIYLALRKNIQLNEGNWKLCFKHTDKLPKDIPTQIEMCESTNSEPRTTIKNYAKEVRIILIK